MNDNVVKLSDVKPKTSKTTYKRVPIKLTYMPKTGKWQWCVSVIIETVYEDVAETEHKALRAAQRYIDKNDLGK